MVQSGLITYPNENDVQRLRPVLNVPPRGIDPIANLNENDVLCSRGKRTSIIEIK